MWRSVITCTGFKVIFICSRYIWMIQKTCTVSSLTGPGRVPTALASCAAVHEVTKSRTQLSNNNNQNLGGLDIHETVNERMAWVRGRGGRNPPGDIKFIYLTSLNQYLEGESCGIYWRSQESPANPVCLLIFSGRRNKKIIKEWILSSKQRNWVEKSLVPRKKKVRHVPSQVTKGDSADIGES